MLLRCLSNAAAGVDDRSSRPRVDKAGSPYPQPTMKGMAMSKFPLRSVPRADSAQRVAVIGTGLAGAACAQSLAAGGCAVSLFDKARGPGGRMATRRVAEQPHAPAAGWQFDHGAQLLQASNGRFRAVLRKAAAAGLLQAWQPSVHAAWPAPRQREAWVPRAGMPALARHLIGELPLQLEWPVQRLQREADSGGWRLVAADGRQSGPYDQVVLAMPPAQAAALLGGHEDAWASALDEWPMAPCWTLMAVTPDLDWPWDACEPDTERSPLAWVARSDRKPGSSPTPGQALWVAHASAAWSARHLEADPAQVQRELSEALAALLPAGRAPRWLYRTVHRWRYAAALPAEGERGEPCWWNAGSGLAVCGDYLGTAAGLGQGVEAAWRSGDELADTILAGFEAALKAPTHTSAAQRPAELLAA